MDNIIHGVTCKTDFLRYKSLYYSAKVSAKVSLRGRLAQISSA